MASLQRYTDRRALITGGGSGIGQAIVLRILDEGGRVVAADVSEAGLKDTAARAEPHAGRLTTLVMDVADEQSVQDGVAKAVELLGGLDTLVNVAGILRSAHFLDTTLADFEQVVRINLVGTFLVTRGVQAMTHALALEFAKEGIRFNAVQPGSISSGMTDGTGESKQSIGPGLPADADFSLFTKVSPVLPVEGGGMFAQPDAVAAVVAMLGSTDAYFVTGTEVRIDGGTHM
jgi:NAD(P)-dependent dehydrogenase (short-subunit alcohol dehydrogenase family)